MKTMEIIGLLLNLAALTVYTVVASDDVLTLSPSTDKVVRFTNESHIVLCNAPTDLKIHWKSPKGDIMKDVKGRIHIEEKTPGQLALIFVHIALSDKGNWTCEDVDGTANANKSFNLVVYQKISFTENATILTVKEGKNATILCEVKGDPEPTVSWQLNGQPIEFSATSKFRKLADGLLIHKVTQNDTGEYTCKAYQFTKDISDVQERTVLMKIEHKPFWTHKHHVSMQYGYPGGRTSISCEAIAEPPANFTWYRNKKRLHSDKYIIHNEPYISTLVIDIKDETLYDTYKCKAANSQGAIERSTQLEKGTKPPPPIHLQLRGFNSNTFDVDVGSVRTTPVRNLMDVNGFRIEFMTDYEFKSAAGNWSYAKRKDFPFEDGATFLIGNLESNTTYLMRAASKNLAGLSDWTKVEKFTTLSNEPPSGGPRSVSLLTALETLCISFAVIAVSNVRPFSNTRGRHHIPVSHGL
ncbi:limbic system-associated membrane protein isoform X1 [Episyrphus balteatus]|uniref:limbic system-associated membrane protein isoform X1 n=1 Tax=Episyrphus balteatus TaxID=286459 RepID=UPI0024863E94|nr:limbic system-associated membrane protein isoform X1 [Episyrphus balteatus]